MQQLQCLLILPSQLKLPRKVKGLCKSHITTNCVLPLLFFTDLEGYESVQSQDQMGRRYKTYNPGEQTAFFAHISPLSVLAFAKLQYNHPVTCAAFSFFFLEYTLSSSYETNNFLVPVLTRHFFPYQVWKKDEQGKRDGAV